jgi:alkylhydroperoxidase family enzyme
VPHIVQEAILTGLQAASVAAPHLTAGERALLAYADVLTQSPWKVTRTDVEALRHAGYDDPGIHDACAIVSYFAFVNRIADGLGVELES